ncbi:HDOD domain-containing protein [Rhodoferax sp.]|uniref:HDOD domain-containing protein n=1 Tax=Rhodoferax sp. TaxID=50421 RepID=UPI0025D5B0C9|nr:HDOD domain-containing protein [Rhodoferax sp.]MCM2297015.1 HDOD domain-containing protein [Rhodoferax sp.]
MQLVDLLAHPTPLPSSPRVQALLLTELRQLQPDLRRIDQFIKADPVLSLRVLQAANEPSLGLCGQVSSVSEALALLHLDQVQGMVNRAIGQASFKVGTGLPLAQFWDYSQDCARVARALAGLLQYNQQAAYVAGLIHALGELTMRAALPQIAELDESCPPLDLNRAFVERQDFGFCYLDVSSALASQAQLPQILCDSLAYADAPFDNDACEPLAAVMHLAQWRARANQLGLQKNALTVTFPSLVAEMLGLDIDMVLQQDPIDWSSQAGGRVAAVAPT